MPIRHYVELTSSRIPSLAVFFVKACLAVSELSRSSDPGDRTHASLLEAELGQFAADLPPSKRPALLQALVEIPVDCIGSDPTLQAHTDSLRSPISASRSFDDAKRSARRIIEAARDQEIEDRDVFWLQQAAL